MPSYHTLWMQSKTGTSAGRPVLKHTWYPELLPEQKDQARPHQKRWTTSSLMLHGIYSWETMESWTCPDQRQVPLERGLLVWKQPCYYWANSELLSQQLAGKWWVCFSLVFRALIWVWEDGQGVLCRIYAAFHSPSFLSFPLPLLPPLPFIIQSPFALVLSLFTLIFVILPLVFVIVPNP